MAAKFIAYYRVSTAKQGSSGLGMDAQREAVRRYLDGGSGELIDEFEEVESGKRSDRPALRLAMERCRQTGATLLIAKLDRLSRNVHFLSGLKGQGVDFVACDMPHANTLTVHVMAAVAEEEAKAISARTKAALGEIRSKLARGEKYTSRRSDRPVTRLGNPDGLSVSRPDLGAAAVSRKAREFGADVLPIIREMRAGGSVSYAAVAMLLNAKHVLAAGGRGWTAMGVWRVIERAERIDA